MCSMFSSMNDREAEWPCQDSGLAAFHISEVTIFRARRKNSRSTPASFSFGGHLTENRSLNGPLNS